MSRLPLVICLVLMALMLTGCGGHNGATNSASSIFGSTDQRNQSEASIVASWPSSAGVNVGVYDIFLTDGNRQVLPPRQLKARLCNDGLEVELPECDGIRGVFVRWHDNGKPILDIDCQRNSMLEHVSIKGYAVAGVNNGNTTIVFNNKSATKQRSASIISSRYNTLNAFYTGRKNEYLLFWLEQLNGDANDNNEVEFSDFGVLGANYGQIVTNVAGLNLNRLDPNGNGKTDFADYGHVGANYGQVLIGYRVFVTTSSKSKTSFTNIYQPVTDLLTSWEYSQDYFVTILNLPEGLTPPFYVEPIYEKSVGAATEAIEPVYSVWLPTVLGGVPINATAQAQRRVNLSWSALQKPDFNNDGQINALDFYEISKCPLNPKATLPPASEYLKLFPGKTGQDAFMDYYSIFSQIGKEPRAGAIPDLYRVIASIYQERTNWSTVVYRFGPDTYLTEPLCKRVGQTDSSGYLDVAPKEGEARYLIVPDPLADLFTYVQNQYPSALPVNIRTN